MLSSFVYLYYPACSGSLLVTCQVLFIYHWLFSIQVSKAQFEKPREVGEGGGGEVVGEGDGRLAMGGMCLSLKRADLGATVSSAQH